MIWLRTFFFTIIAPGTVTVILPGLLLPRGAFILPNWSIVHVIALALGIAGLGLYVRCARDFVLIGHGTPAPYDPPKQLVVSGLYRYTRNPMYLGIMFILLGEALWFAALVLLAYSLIVFLGFHLRVLRYEEPHLRRLFGTDFEQYCRKVPRWLPKFSGMRT